MCPMPVSTKISLTRLKIDTSFGVCRQPDAKTYVLLLHFLEDVFPACTHVQVLLIVGCAMKCQQNIRKIQSMSLRRPESGTGRVKRNR